MNFHIKNLGCKYNSFESNKIKELLLKNGFIASSADDANFIIINTCSVTQVADKKTRQMIRSYKNNNKNAIIVAIGCSVDLNYDELKEFTDILIKNDEKDDILNILKEYIKTHDIKEKYKENNNQEVNNHEVKSEIQNNVRAFVGIQNGCNQFCTYCIIPYLRGRIRSKSEENILKEVKELTKKGIKEIVYTGIHLSSYSLSGNESYENENDRIKARKNLINLLIKTAEIEDVKRIRLGSLECRIIDDEFLDAVLQGELKNKFCPSFCLSLQSGSDKVLKNMNRHYTASEYEDIVNKIRNKIPNATITTDIILGFPGEDETEFNKTLDYVKRIKFYNPNIFPYSKRKGTKAYDFKDQIDNNVKHERAKIVLYECEKITDNYNKKLDGKILDVLIEEKKILNDKIVFTGYTKEYIYVNIIGIDNNGKIDDFKNDVDLIGKVLDVKIAYKNGEIIGFLQNL